MTSNVIPLSKRKKVPKYTYLVVVMICVLTSMALLVVSFRLGTIGLALSVTLALMLRAGVAEDRVGLLAVRTAKIDIATLMTLSIVLFVLALIVPGPV